MKKGGEHMLHLYIARHGQTHWNVEKRMRAGWILV